MIHPDEQPQLQDRPATIAGRWPDITRNVRAPLRARGAQAVLRRAAHRVDINVKLADGTMVRAHNPAWPTMEVRSPRFFDRVAKDLRVGFGEAYMAGAWAPAAGTDLADLLTVFAHDLDGVVPAWLMRLRRLVEPQQPRHERNTRRGAKANIARHYDLSNELFATFLDETMMYSAAWFGHGLATSDRLAEAQRRKVDRLLDTVGIGPGVRLLEIGSGWGQLALQAAQRGADVCTITLSEEQQKLARSRIAEAGMSDRVQVSLCDYRDIGGTYDAIISVEMIEAVGEPFLADYFANVARMLRPGGRFGLQAITMPHHRMLRSKQTYSWIHKYIFPGGFIPSLQQIGDHASHAGLGKPVAELSLGADYAETLRIWRNTFINAADSVEGLGFDQTFRRMWEFYLAYSEAGFRSGHLDDWQLTFVRR